MVLHCRVAAARGGVYHPITSGEWSAVVSVVLVVAVYLLARAFPRFFPALGSVFMIALISAGIATGLQHLGVVATPAVPIAIWCCFAVILTSYIAALWATRYHRK